jgi:hypothetical protein
MAKALKKKGECSFCGSLARDPSVFGIPQRGSGNPSSPLSLSHAQIYRLEGISHKITGYIAKEWAPPSALGKAMAQTDATESGSDFERLLQERMKSERIEDEDLYKDLLDCFYESATGKYGIKLFSIFFKCIAAQPDAFALPLLDSALKASVRSKDRTILTFLTQNCVKFSSSARCDAMQDVVCLDRIDEFEERAKLLCSIDTELQPEALSPFLNNLICCSLSSVGMKFHMQMLKRLVEEGKIPEKMKIDKIKFSLSNENCTAFKILLGPPISQREREEALLCVIGFKGGWSFAFDSVKLLLDQQATISPDYRGAALCRSLKRGSKELSDYNLEMTLFLATGGPLSHSYMKKAVEIGSSFSDLTILNSLIAPSVLENVEDLPSDYSYWGHALEQAAKFGNKVLIELLLNKKEFSFQAVEAALMETCSERSDSSPEIDVDLLVQLLAKLPSDGALSGKLLVEAVQRQDPKILRILLQHRESNPDRWISVPEKEWEQAVKALFFFLSMDPSEVSDSHAAFELLLEKEGDKIPIKVVEGAINYGIDESIKLKFLNQIGWGLPSHEPRLHKLKLLLQEAERRSFPLPKESKKQLLLIFASSPGYEPCVQQLLTLPSVENMRSSVLYWEEVVQPALERGISERNVKMVKILLDHGEISTKMRMKAIAQADKRDLDIIALLKKKAPIYQGRWDRIKGFFVDLWMGLGSFLRRLCSWRLYRSQEERR